MEFRMVSPHTLQELTKSRALERRLKDKPAGSTRRKASSLNCYLPAGDATPHRRITGCHLDPDSDEMMQAAMVLAGSLLHALDESSVPARILVSPVRYGPKVLTAYCQMLIKHAFGKPTLSMISPLLVPYLLGGMPYKGVEDLAHKALDVMDFFPEPQGKSVMARALSCVGFGAGVPHIHEDECVDASYVEPVKKRYNNLSYQQEFLLNLPSPASYARQLIDKGAYQESLRRTLTAMKLEVLDEAERLLDPAGGEMTEFAARGRMDVARNDRSMLFARAVRRVFEKPWAELDLSGDNGDRFNDLEVLIARLIIQRLSHKVLKSDKLSATTLVGMSLLTGVSVANWAQFAVYDLRRRGETFLTADTLDEVVSIIEVSPHFNCEQELRGMAVELRYGDIEKAKWARRLQSPNRPLWSRNSKFYQNGIDLNGFPTYTHKPFSLSRD